LAGLRVLRMMNEPSAAALVYSIDKQATPGTVLVFDLGGGTFDATILQLEEKESRVLATQGIEELGGINFTKALADFLALRYVSQTKTPYPQDSLSLERLISEAEAAKCQLSESLTATVSLVSSAGQAATLTITREQFEDIIDLFSYQLQTAVEMALEQAKKTPTDIGRVLLCGGSSRIPAIQTMLANLFGRPPPLLDCHFDLPLLISPWFINRCLAFRFRFASLPSPLAFSLSRLSCLF